MIPDHGALAGGQRTAGSLQAGLRRDTLAEQISGRMMEGIATEGLQPGDLLPSEATLAAAYGVSRAVIREALRALSALSIIRMTNGARATVRPLSSELLNVFFHWAMSLRAANLDEVLELRRGMEGQAVALAAGRLGPGGRLKLQETLRRMEEGLEDRDRYAAADLQLHLAIAQASGNALIWHLTDGMQSLLRQMIGDGLASLHGDHDAWFRMHEGHESLVRALLAGDAEAARASVSAGTDWAIERYVRDHEQVAADLAPDAVHGRQPRERPLAPLASPDAETMAERVAHGVMAAIVSEGLQAGDAIPSEAALGETYGVSRGVVREALRGLAALSIIAVTTGRRAEVLPFSPALLSTYLRWAIRLEAITIVEVHELRAGVEGQSARLAAKRATPRQAALLRSTVARMRDALDDPPRFGRLDLELHLTIAEASGNRLVGHVLGSFRDVIQDTIREGLEPIRQNPAELDAMQSRHESLIEAINRGDGDAAEASVREGTRRVIERLQGLAPDAGV
ncbi:MAG: FCD domain-containing protein [Candidatus Dormiibacterota bacterium]